MGEAQAELILLGDESLTAKRELRADVFAGERQLAQGVRPVVGRRVIVPFDLTALPMGETEVTCVLKGTGEERRVSALVTKLEPKAGAVQIDYVGGGLIVDGLPFFPFGFYCEPPAQLNQLEEEVVRGFNAVSPPLPNGPAGVAERLRYLNRAAQLGMRVNYPLGSISVLGSGPDAVAREQALRQEVEGVRDHPGLLGWYLCDEPDGNKIAPEELARSYRIVRELDPYHPITMVFMAPEPAKQFAAATDVVMTDPYPIPDDPVTDVHRAIALLVSEFGGEKPVWLVPQAFGGNEWWEREPTAAEERVMTYLGLIDGATGVVYYVRHGLNGFPKSTITWGECSRLALEGAELSPALLSHEARPRAKSSADSIHVGAWRDRGMIYVLAANTENRPQMMRLEVEGVTGRGEAKVIFENRTVSFARGVVRDMIDAYGTRAYRIPIGPMPAEDLTVDPRNLIVNPSFEENPNTGAPEGCYANIGAARGVTYFTDSRVARHGGHSVRLAVPEEGQRVCLDLYPAPVTQGKTYRFSVWAKAAAPRTAGGPWPQLLLELQGVTGKQFTLTEEWQPYAIEGPVNSKRRRLEASVGLVSPGTAWIDLVELVEQQAAQ